MIGISGVRTPIISGNEKKDQRINKAATGIAAAEIAGTAVLAGAVIKNAKTEGTHLFKAVASVKEFANNAVSYVSKKASALIPEKLTTKVVGLKKQVVESKVGLNIAGAAGKVAEMAGVVAKKGQSVIGNVKEYVSKMPLSVKIAAGVATALLAVSYINKKGQISGAYAAQKQQASE